MPKLNTLTVTLMGVLSYLGTTVAVLRPGALVPPPPPPAEPEEHIVGENYDASWNFDNPEINKLMTELQEERLRLAEQERGLKELQARLTNERAELTQVTQSVHRLQMQLDRSVVYIKRNESANLKRLAKLYTTMSPAGALDILEQFDDAMFVRILSFMKETESAALLEALAKEGPEKLNRAAVLADQLRLTMQEAQQSSRK